MLERYRLQRRLGAGAFGTVWLAHDERLDREVAVKILPRERIIGGASSARPAPPRGSPHPGIVTLYEAAVDDEGAYLVSELVRGTTLDAAAASRPPVGPRHRGDRRSPSATPSPMRTQHGVVHRDVKPSNVLVPERPAQSPRSSAKLTDFGVARVVGGDSLTRTGDVIGTLAYMAPEQAEGREAGAGADLYSLALVALRGAHRRQPGPDRHRSAARTPARSLPAAAATPAPRPPARARARGSISRFGPARANAARCTELRLALSAAP